jgi:hypothetical protein
VGHESEPGNRLKLRVAGCVIEDADVQPDANSKHNAVNAQRAFKSIPPPSLSTPLMAVKPIIDQRMRQRLRLLAVAGDDFPCAFNITGMNGYAPLIPFDPGADGVPYTSVFHQGTLRSN